MSNLMSKIYILSARLSDLTNMKRDMTYVCIMCSNVCKIAQLKYKSSNHTTCCEENNPLKIPIHSMLFLIALF